MRSFPRALQLDHRLQGSAAANSTDRPPAGSALHICSHISVKSSYAATNHQTLSSSSCQLTPRTTQLTPQLVPDHNHLGTRILFPHDISIFSPTPLQLLQLHVCCNCPPPSGLAISSHGCYPNSCRKQSKNTASSKSRAQDQLQTKLQQAPC